MIRLLAREGFAKGLLLAVGYTAGWLAGRALAWRARG